MRDFHHPGRSAVFAENGICATSHPLAAQTAIATLQAGGNAVDAAIAGAVLLGLCEPAMTGIGGDCFVLLKPAGSEEVIALNGSGRAPAALSGAELRAQGHDKMPVFGHPAAVTIPGAIDAFCRLSADHGRLGLDAVLAPTIHYAEAGVPAAPRAQFDWTHHHENMTPTARRYYLIGDKPPRLGERFRHPGQAEVLRRVARDGRRGFYEGEVAEDMVASLRALGGVHTLEDFANTACDYTKPVSGTYKGIELVEHPPNGQGATAILLANILAEFDLPSMDPWGVERAHIEAEATKLAYDARDRFLSDADHMTRLAYMLDPATARKLAGLIDPTRAMPSARAMTEEMHKETIYLTVIDKDRMAVSLIYSVFKDFGSGIASDKFGILFQNRGAGFTLEEGHPNEANGGKRPMHTIIPAMLKKDGKVIMPFGVMGGQYQSTGHARMLTNMVDYGLGPQEMIDAPRCFSEYGEMKVEKGYGAAIHQGLADLGHKVSVPPVGIGGAQAIRIHDDLGVLEGGSDPRKDGIALGY